MHDSVNGASATVLVFVLDWWVGTRKLTRVELQRSANAKGSHGPEIGTSKHFSSTRTYYVIHLRTEGRGYGSEEL